MVKSVGSVVEALHSFRSGDVLLDDRSCHGRFQLDQWAGVSGVGAQEAHFMIRGFDVYLGLVF